MHHRHRLVSAPWLIPALALLALVLAAPVGMSGFITASPGPNCVRRDLALPPAQPTARLGAGSATDAVLQVNALPAEDEEQDRVDALDGPRALVLVPFSFRKIRDCRLAAPRSTPSRYPLRC